MLMSRSVHGMHTQMLHVPENSPPLMETAFLHMQVQAACPCTSQCKYSKQRRVGILGTCLGF